ncbi:MAG: trypsin-like peptidase domain-containing protein [Gammaproteobacteria bacterium]|nr:trypsin-like peptidase domain-containing protein [Gammaproteobacteria bacterium]
MLRVSSLCLLFWFSTSTWALDSEDIFRLAEKYTVKIKTTSNHAYLGEKEGVGIGAGFLIDKQRRWVITNRHVVAAAPSMVEVRFKGGDYVKAKKIYLDPQIDLAVIQLPPDQLPAASQVAELSCAAMPDTGHPVITFGHPSDLSFTGTRGIISGTTYVDGNEWLQTDAPINPGNSGGPLISIKSAEVVGINSAKFDEDAENLNLALPIQHACKVIELLKAGKNPNPAQLPVVFLEYDVDNPKLVVAKNNDQSRVPLQIGDHIYGVNGHSMKISHKEQLLYLMRGKTEPVELQLIRNGNRITLPVKFPLHPNLLDETGLAFSGMTVKSLQLIDQPDRNEGESLYVVSVKSGSIAEGSGFQKWDMIYRAEGEEIIGIEQLQRLLQPMSDNRRSASIIVKRISTHNNKYYDYIEDKMPIRELQLLLNRN